MKRSKHRSKQRLAEVTAGICARYGSSGLLKDYEPDDGRCVCHGEPPPDCAGVVHAMAVVLQVSGRVVHGTLAGSPDGFVPNQ